MNANSLRVN